MSSDSEFTTLFKMVKCGSFRCTVPDCNRYKLATNDALVSFETKDLREAIRLRKEYYDQFIGGDK